MLRLPKFSAGDLFGPGRPRTPWQVVREVFTYVLLCTLTVLSSALDEASLTRAVLAALFVAAVFPFRFRFPATALLVAAVASEAYSTTGFLVLALAYGAGYRIGSWRKSLSAFGAATAVMLVGTVANAGWRLGEPLQLTNTVALGVLLGLLVPGLLGRYRSQRGLLVKAYRERNAYLERERHGVAEQARLRERTRIAQDMHDSLGHQLSLISLHTGALEMDPALQERHRETVQLLRRTAAGAMEELRQVIGALRQEGYTTEPHSMDRIESLVQQVREAGMVVRLTRRGEPHSLSPLSRAAAFRVVQEGLTNAHKHAPGAPVRVALRYEPDALVVEVVNPVNPVNPVSPVTAASGSTDRPVSSGGQGLPGLRERARLAGGVLHAAPNEEGFRLAAVLPSTSDGPAAEGGTGSPDPLRRLVRSAGGPADGVDQPPVLLAAARSRRLLIGSATTTGLLLFAVLAFGAYQLYHVVADSYDRSVLADEVYQRARLGAAQREVERTLPKPAGRDFDFNEDLANTGGTVPAGASCRYFRSNLAMDEKAPADLREQVYRLCFRDGRLLEKKRYPDPK